MARDKTSINLEWLFKSRSRLKLLLIGTLPETVFLRSLLWRWWEISFLFYCYFVITFPGERILLFRVIVAVVARDSFRQFTCSAVTVFGCSIFWTPNPKTSLQSALCFAFLVSILLRILWVSILIAGVDGITSYSCSTARINLAILLLSKGQNPKSILKRTTPRDQISALIV